ncbi:efflux RND transporter permease subunit [Bradyrhizobium sp. B117]|uniref:efflux RND transporter permease subunit n=1 Tax=Bradyrhizobium sp. B117 TaxID=3140246 RepID=UPI00318409E5
MRLRPILMTSFAFILGVQPPVISTGSGSEMRQAVGVAVFFGMLGVTLFGLISRRSSTWWCATSRKARTSARRPGRRRLHRSELR